MALDHLTLKQMTVFKALHPELILIICMYLESLVAGQTALDVSNLLES